MHRDRLTNLARTQTIAVFPLELCMHSAAILFDLRSVFGLKSILPGQVNSLSVVTRVHHLLTHEPFFDRRIQAFKDFAIVSNRGRASLSGCLHTMKPDLRRPVV